MEDFYNNGFWDDICEEEGCFETATRTLVNKVYCDGHYVVNAAKIGLKEDGPDWTDADKLRARALGVIF